MKDQIIERFIIIDLISQSGAVARYVKGWSASQILQWLARRGELTQQLDPRGNNIFYFRSNFNLGYDFECWFWLDCDQFTFIGDNTTFRPIN